MFKWFLESNRYKHCIVGLVIFEIHRLNLIILDYQFNWKLALVGLYTVLVAMSSLEFKDKATGGKFDIIDIIAGIIYPCLIILYYILRYEIL